MDRYCCYVLGRDLGDEVTTAAEKASGLWFSSVGGDLPIVYVYVLTRSRRFTIFYKAELTVFPFGLGV